MSETPRTSSFENKHSQAASSAASLEARERSGPDQLPEIVTTGAAHSAALSSVVEHVTVENVVITGSPVRFQQRGFFSFFARLSFCHRILSISSLTLSLCLNVTISIGATCRKHSSGLPEPASKNNIIQMLPFTTLMSSSPHLHTLYFTRSFPRDRTPLSLPTTATHMIVFDSKTRQTQ